MLMDAASHAEVDPLRGVSEKIMVGQLAGIGTGQTRRSLRRSRNRDWLNRTAQRLNGGSPSRRHRLVAHLRQLLSFGREVGIVRLHRGRRAVVGKTH